MLSVGRSSTEGRTAPHTPANVCYMAMDYWHDTGRTINNRFRSTFCQNRLLPFIYCNNCHTNLFFGSSCFSPANDVVASSGTPALLQADHAAPERLEETNAGAPAPSNLDDVLWPASKLRRTSPCVSYETGVSGDTRALARRPCNFSRPLRALLHCTGETADIGLAASLRLVLPACAMLLSPTSLMQHEGRVMLQPARGHFFMLLWDIFFYGMAF